MPNFIVPPPDLSGVAKVSDIPQSFVTQSIVTIAQLMADYPAGSAFRGKYCRVSDLWGAVDGVMRCGYNGRIYYWEPTTQNTLIGQVPVAGDMTVQPLSSFPIIELTGSVPTLTTRTINAGLDYAWPGAVKEFRGSLTSLLGTLNIIGTGIGSTIAMALGGNRRIACYDNGTALVWRQLN
jgi:hypothetical protein